MCFQCERFDEVFLYVQQYVAEEFEPDMLLNSLGPRISSEDFDEIRARHRLEVMEKLGAQLNKSRAMMPDYDSRR